MTNDKALVERLRDESIVGMPMENEAADRIEAQAKLIAKLEADNANLFSQVKIADAQWDEKCDRIEAQAAEIERLRAEVKNAWCDDALPCRQLMDAKQEIVRLREALVAEREENLWNAYATGDVRGDEWTHLFMSDGEWLAKECGFDPRQGYYSAEAIRNAIPIAARAALGDTK